MKITSRKLFLWVALLLASSLAVHAQEPPPAAQPEAAEAPAAQAEEPVEVEREAIPESEPAAAERNEEDEPPFRWRTREDNVVLHIGEDAHLASDDEANAVIAVFGSATSEGEVREAVVSVFGNTRSTGPVGQAVVAVFGNTYVDEHVGDEAVAILGDVTLGPNAEIDGDVVAVGGRVTRDPGAVIHGDVREVGIAHGFIQVEGLRIWLQHCLLYGRPLAIEPGLGWAWGVAFGFLAFYILLAVLFGDAMDKCVRTLETRPGESVVAALLSVLLTPVMFILLLITVIGILLIPFLGIALFAAGLFGKAVVLAWLGRRATRITGIDAFEHIVLAVLVGGLIMMGVYVLPVMGYIAYNVGNILGAGVVIYTVLLAIQAKRAPAPALASATPSVAAGQVETPPASEQPGAAPSVASSPPLPNGLASPRAGFWIRMGALLIDTVLVSIVAGDALLIALAAYGAIMWKLKGATIGGMVCNLRVVRLDGREIEWDTALVRALSCFLSLAPAGLGFIWIAIDADRQSWHDKIAGTVVVRVPKAAPATVQTAPDHV